MARLPRCYECDHFDIWKRFCDIYPHGVPYDIMVELVKCDKYKLKIDTDTDDSLPIATGR